LAQKPERISFTKTSLDRLKPIPGKRRTVWDTNKPKLCVRITEMGAMSFYYVTKVNRKTEWVRLGRYPDMSPAAARARADIESGRFAVGQNPAEELRQDRSEWSLEKAWTEYGKYRVRKLNAQGKSEAKITRALEAHDAHWRLRYSKWQNRRLSTITGGMAEKLQDEVLDTRSGATTNRVIASGRAVFNFAIRRQSSGFDGPNPFVGLEKLPEKRRKDKLRRHQIPDFFVALDSISELMRDFILIGLWTGRRAGDIKSMRWVDVDLDSGSWLIPDPKSGEPQEVALSLPAIEILARRKRTVRGQWVFPTGSRSGHIEEYKKAWQRVRELAGLGGLRFHDLRRTLSSFAQENRIPVTVAGAQLGHKDPATTLRHYTDIALYAQREAVNVVADAILAAKEK